MTKTGRRIKYAVDLKAAKEEESKPAIKKAEPE